MRKGTGSTTWQLTSPQAAPTYAAGGVVRFDLNDVPAYSPTGPLAYYLTALILTFVGTLTNAGESATAIPAYDLPGLIIKNVQLQNCWHGTPISSDYWLGEHLRTIEYVGNGYQFGQRIGGLVAPGVDTLTSSCVFSVRLPLCKGTPNLERDTSQLALLYQPGSLIVNLQPAATLANVSTGTSFAGTVLCSAELDPRPEIVLGTGIEWVLHRQVASTNGFQIQIKGFGRSSKFTGVQEKGGVLSLMEMTSLGSPTAGGRFVAQNITAYGNDWRGQNVTNDVRSVLSALVQQIPDFMPGVPDVVGDDTEASNERSVFPYFQTIATAGAEPLAGLIAWPMALSGINARLTDPETAETDQTYRLEVAGGFSAGDHLILAEYAKPWNDGKIAQFKAKVMDSGVAEHVLQDRAKAAVMRQRAPFDKHSLTADELCYLAWQLDVAA